MPLNFPSAPVQGQTYTDPNNVVWEYDGVKWDTFRGLPYRFYSGVKVKFDTDYNLTSTSTAVDFDSEEFDTDNYFTTSNASRITVGKSAFYRINLSVYSGSSGSSYTISLVKNGTTTVSSTTISPNQYSSYDEIIELQANDYLELKASESSSVGTLLSATRLEVTRIGLTTGTYVSNSESFSGARATRTTTYNTTSSSTAVAWSTTAFNQNADPAGNVYWVAGSASKLTVHVTGYYRVVANIAIGATESVTLALKKNGSTTLASATISPNGTAQIDSVYSFSANDYIEIFANDTSSTGTITNSSYFEITRLGV